MVFFQIYRVSKVESSLLQISFLLEPLSLGSHFADYISGLEMKIEQSVLKSSNIQHNQQLPIMKREMQNIRS